MAKFFNRVKVAITSTGTGSVTCGAALAGFQSLADASVANSDVVRYTIIDGNSYESGTGTVTLSGSTYSISRGPSVSSESNNSAIDVTSSANLFLTMLAQDVKQVLSDLDNVSTTAPAGGQVLSYDTNSASWVPSSPSGGIVSVANYAALPASPSATDLAWTEDTKSLYIYDGAEWDRFYTDTNATPEWTTSPPEFAALADDGTATTQTVVASDPEGFPVEYSYDTNPSNQSQATISQANNVFTITPSTTLSDAGNFTLRYKATDGIHSTSRSTQYSLSFFTQASSLFGRWDIGTSSSYSGSGTTWNDLSGNGRNLTIQNGAYNSNGFGGTPVWEWTSTDARIDLPDDLSSVKTFMIIWGFPTGSNRQILINEGSNDYAGYLSSSSSGNTLSGGATHSGESRSTNMNGNYFNASGNANSVYNHMEVNKLNIHTVRGYQANESGITYANYSSYNHAHQLRAIIMWTVMLTDAEIKEVYDRFPSGSMATWDG